MKHLFFIFTILLSGCAPASHSPSPDRQDFPVRFFVTDDEQMPVPGSMIIVNQRTLYVSPRGTATFLLHGKEGDAVVARVVCPAGWRPSQSDEKPLILKNITAGNTVGGQTGELSFTCIPEQKKHVLIVQCNQPLLPVQINGKTVMHTNRDGIAQLVLSGPPGDRILLQLSTEEHPFLTPRNPSLVVTLPDKRKFLVFEQSFEESRPARRKRKARRQGPRRL
jgi:hypothetical protein